MLKQARDARQKAIRELKAAEEALKQAGRTRPTTAAAKSRPAIDAARAAADAARKARKQAEDQYRAASQASRAARRKADDILGKSTPAPLKRPVKETVIGVLTALTRDPTLYALNSSLVDDLLKDVSAKRRNVVAAARKRLSAFGLLKERPGSFLLQTRKQSGPLRERLTRFEAALLQRYHAEILGNVLYPGVITCSPRLNYADPQITAPKAWRDVYRYAPDGTPLGWTRYDARGRQRFNAEGLLVVKSDAAGRCVEAKKVAYHWTGVRRSRTFTWRATDEVHRYVYSGPTDWKGRPAAAATRPAE